MATPTALVEIELRRVLGLSSAARNWALLSPVYAVAKINQLRLGRSKKSDGGAQIDLQGYQWAFRYTEVLTTSDPVRVEVSVFADRGDRTAVSVGHLVEQIPRPWSPGLRTLGLVGGLQVECFIKTTLFPELTVAPIPRGAPGVRSGAVLMPPYTVFVELTDIKGLFRPATPSAANDHRNAEYVPGYFSDDHRGRVYTNYDPLANAFHKDRQFIELHAKVTASNGPLPPNAKVRWTMVVPDNPTDTWLDTDSLVPNVHLSWAATFDPDDYEADGTPRAPLDGDNEGRPEFSPPWSQVGAYSVQKHDTFAVTDIVAGESAVQLQCPDVGGDRLLVRVDIENPAPAVGFGTQTGVMTMWRRIDLRYLKMAAALDLPVDRIPPFFEPAFVQFDPRPVQPTTTSPQFLAPSEAALDAKSAIYFRNEFHLPHLATFCLIAAKEPHHLPSTPGGTLHTGTATVSHIGAGADQLDTLLLNTWFPEHHQSAYVECKWTHPVTGLEASIGFEVTKTRRWETPGAAGAPPNRFTRIYLEAHDVHPDFTAGDGSEAHAYSGQSYECYPQGVMAGSVWTPGGNQMVGSIAIEVFRAGAMYTDGISPGVSVGGRDYFAGQTILFTHHGAYYDHATASPVPGYQDDILATIVHELGHAFGMPHKCGYFNFKTVASAPRMTCAMNYPDMWMLDDSHQPIVDTAHHRSQDLCGRHAKEIMRVHLEDNPGLRWR